MGKDDSDSKRKKAGECVYALCVCVREGGGGGT